MRPYRYKVLDPHGELVEGRVRAADSGEVVRWLQDQGQMPVEVEPAMDAGAASWRRLMAHPLSGAALVRFTQQLATLLGSGQPLDRALTLLLDSPADKERTRRPIAAIRDAVREGSSLAGALASQHGVFSDLYINMVRAGETGGALHSTLEHLGEYLERGEALKARVINAMVYPAILLCLVGFSLLFLLAYVVPQFAAMYDSLEAEVPLLTSVVLDSGAFARNWWLLLIAAPLLAIVGFERLWRSPGFRVRVDGWLLERQRVGALLTGVETARFARTLGVLLANGVALLAALDLGRRVLRNRVLASRVEQATADVRNGGRLASSLQKAGGFPALAVQMIQVGEESGELAPMLAKVATNFEREASLSLDRMVAVLVPGMTVVLGIIVMLVIVAVLTPIYDLTTVIQ